MSIFDTFQTDNNKELDGVWINYPESENKDGSIPGFKICAMYRSNMRYVRELEKATKPIQRKLGKGTIGNEEGRKILLHVFCKTILIDWRNVQNTEGTEIQFSIDQAIGLMESLPRLYDDLSEQAQSEELFRDEIRDEIAKN